MTDQPPDDDRTREMAIPERVSPDAAGQAGQAGRDEPAGAAATAPQQLPSQSEQAPQGSQSEQAAQGPPPPGPAKATAPQVVPPEPPAPQPVPQQPAQAPQPVPQPMQMAAPPPQQPMQAPPQQPLPALPGPRQSVTFHRFHYPIGIFLVAYGVSTLLLSVLGWSAHRKEMADYLGEGVASPALIAVKAVEGLLVLLTLVGLARRRDVWFLPALFGWALGFGAFCVLDGAKGKMLDLVEHGAYLVVFAFLLCLSYALGVKARVAARQAAPEDPGQDRPGQGQGPGQLTRTQEIALAALNRWQRQQPAPQQPPYQPGQQQPQAPQQYGPPPQQQYGAVPQGPGQFYSDPPPGQR